MAACTASTSRNVRGAEQRVQLISCIMRIVDTWAPWSSPTCGSSQFRLGAWAGAGRADAAGARTDAAGDGRAAHGQDGAGRRRHPWPVPLRCPLRLRRHRPEVARALAALLCGAILLRYLHPHSLLACSAHVVHWAPFGTCSQGAYGVAFTLVGQGHVCPLVLRNLSALHDGQYCCAAPSVATAASSQFKGGCC